MHDSFDNERKNISRKENNKRKREKRGDDNQKEQFKK